MEGLTKRSYAIAGLFVVAGAMMMMTPKASFATPKPESQLEQMAPGSLPGYTMLENPEAYSDPKLKNVSYRMDESTYTELQPYGIVCRIFEKDKQRFDTVLISSNKKSSFHDPRVCFRAQGWTFDSERQDKVATSRGDIPITLVSMKNAQNVPYIAAFFYKGPEGFRSTPQSLAYTMIKQQILGNTKIEGVFYRFIPTYEGATESELKDFIRLYVEEAQKTSSGFF